MELGVLERQVALAKDQQIRHGWKNQSFVARMNRQKIHKRYESLAMQVSPWIKMRYPHYPNVVFEASTSARIFKLEAIITAMLVRNGIQCTGSISCFKPCLCEWLLTHRNSGRTAMVIRVQVSNWQGNWTYMVCWGPQWTTVSSWVCTVHSGNTVAL